MDLPSGGYISESDDSNGEDGDEDSGDDVAPDDGAAPAQVSEDPDSGGLGRSVQQKEKKINFFKRFSSKTSDNLE